MQFITSIDFEYIYDFGTIFNIFNSSLFKLSNSLKLKFHKKIEKDEDSEFNYIWKWKKAKLIRWTNQSIQQIIMSEVEFNVSWNSKVYFRRSPKNTSRSYFYFEIFDMLKAYLSKTEIKNTYNFEMRQLYSIISKRIMLEVRTEDIAQSTFIEVRELKLN